MKRSPTRLLILFVLAACGTGLAPQPPKAELETTASPAEPGNRIRMSGVKLYLHDTRPTYGLPRKPTFMVQADVLALMQEDVWTLEKAHAVVLGGDEDAEDMVFEAARGRFQEEERVHLEGGVVAHVGTLVMELEDIEWINTDREARTDNPVHIVDGETHLDAATLRLYLDERLFVLTDVKGVIRLDREEQ